MTSAYGLIHREAGVSGLSFPDLPGVVATGRTADAAVLRLRRPRPCRFTWPAWPPTATRFAPPDARAGGGDPPLVLGRAVSGARTEEPVFVLSRRFGRARMMLVHDKPIAAS